MINLHLSESVFNEAYLPYLQDNHKYMVLYGGSGSGKSVFVAQKLIIKACSSKRRILCIRKTMASQKDSCWKNVKDILSGWNLLQYCTVNKTDYTITFPNGSELLFKGLDDPEKIKSITGITDCWCEECTELNEADFDQLILRVRAEAPARQILVSFNPVSKANWVYKRWFVNQVPDDTVVIKTTYKDNKYLDQDYIDNLERFIDINPVYYQIYALGEFCSLDRRVYNNWQVEDFDPAQIAGKRIFGLDFGYVNDPSAICCSIVNEDRLYIYKEWGDTDKTNPELADIIKSLGLAKEVIICDAAEQKSIDELRRCGVFRAKECSKGPDSINFGIQKLQQYQIIVHPSCTGTITELENYTWQKDRSGEYINKPVDSFNHYLDALRYSIQAISKSHLSPMSKEKLGL